VECCSEAHRYCLDELRGIVSGGGKLRKTRNCFRFSHTLAALLPTCTHSHTTQQDQITPLQLVSPRSAVSLLPLTSAMLSPSLRRATLSLKSCARPTRSLATSAPLRKAATLDRDPNLKVTTLPNGVRVATDPTPGHFVAAGVYVDAGSRYESSRTTGAAHMTDRLAFKVRSFSSLDFRQLSCLSFRSPTHTLSSSTPLLYHRAPSPVPRTK
jgi:hypothetical protein